MITGITEEDEEEDEEDAGFEDEEAEEDDQFGPELAMATHGMGHMAAHEDQLPPEPVTPLTPLPPEISDVGSEPVSPGTLPQSAGTTPLTAAALEELEEKQEEEAMLMEKDRATHDPVVPDGPSSA
jgi:hypothetical protein